MPHIEISAEKLFYFLGLPITNTLLASWVVVGVLVLGAALIAKRIRLHPSGPQNVIEVVLEWLIGMMAGVFGTRAKAEKYLPVVATIFFFVLLSNWFGIFPGVGSIGFYAPAREAGERVFVPFLRSAASDLNFTVALAVTAVIIVNILGIAAIGTKQHFGKFFTLKSPIDAFVGLLEFISEIAKMISFSFRLFGNVFAGEVLLIITGFLIPYLVPVPFLALELFVGFIQAFVFAMLTMVFISIAVAEHQ